MQYFIQILFKYNAVILFIILQVICFSLIVRFNGEQRKIYDATTRTFAAKIFNIRSEVTKHFSFEKKNKKLAEDNANLFQQLEESKFNNIIETDTSENADYLQQYTYTAAQIINNSTNKANNYITINRGKRHGVRKHNGVIGGTGIVGIVLGVSENYSIIMSLLHQQSKTSVSIKNKGYFGSMVWKGNESSFMNIEAIPRHANIVEGDTVITSGYSSIFPGGYQIGIVDDVDVISGSSFHKIKVKLSEDLNKVKHVYVINNLFQDEQKELEEEVEDE